MMFLLFSLCRKDAVKSRMFLVAFLYHSWDFGRHGNEQKQVGVEMS